MIMLLYQSKLSIVFVTIWSKSGAFHSRNKRFVSKTNDTQFFHCESHQSKVEVDVSRGLGTPLLGPISFIFMQFRQKIAKLPTPPGLAPLALGNPGSTTAMLFSFHMISLFEPIFLSLSIIQWYDFYTYSSIQSGIKLQIIYF